MNEHETRLHDLPGPILELDIDPFGNCVALCGARHDPMHLVLSGSSVPLRRTGRFPLIRALDAEHVVLVDTRCGPRERNAFIARRDGTTVHEFRVGDAVADVIVAGDHIVATYFDEAFGASDGLAGVVVFDRAGRAQLRDRDPYGGSVVDCYCACDAGRGRVFFLAYPEFLGVLLDVRAGTRSAWATPRPVHGASAVTVAGNTAFFFGSYDDRDAVTRWRFGSSDAERLGSGTGPLRGLRSGRMLAVRASGYSVLSFDEFAS
jgi:hypothetical protein